MSQLCLHPCGPRPAPLAVNFHFSLAPQPFVLTKIRILQIMRMTSQAGVRMRTPHAARSPYVGVGVTSSRAGPG